MRTFFLYCYFLSSPHFSISKFLTSAAIFTGRREASNKVIFPTPLFPFLTFSYASLTVFPTGEIQPIPVITTLRLAIVYSNYLC